MLIWVYFLILDDKYVSVIKECDVKDINLVKYQKKVEAYKNKSPEKRLTSELEEAKSLLEKIKSDNKTKTSDLNTAQRNYENSNRENNELSIIFYF